MNNIKELSEKLGHLNDLQFNKVEKLVNKLLAKNTSVPQTSVFKPKTSVKKQRHKKTPSGKGRKIARFTELPIGPRENLFDKMVEKSAHKEDTEVDKKLSRKPPVSRKTRKTIVEVECLKCEELYEISSKLLREDGEFVCDECMSSRGR